MTKSNIMVSLLTVLKAQQQLSHHTKARRLNMGLTQEGLSTRADVKLPTLRKFEQKGVISLESFLKLLAVLDGLESIVQAVKPPEEEYSSIEDILKKNKRKPPQKGWRK